jgi:hypothetical protein
MNTLDLDAYDRSVFQAIAELIKERNSNLDEEAINQEALDLMEQHVRAVSVLSLRDPDQPDWDRSELEQLYEHAAGLARVLKDLSPESQIELQYMILENLPPEPKKELEDLSVPELLSDLNRLHWDVQKLSDSLRDGLKKRPPTAQGRPKDIPLAILVEEAVTVFEKASGIDLDNLPDARSQSSRDKKHELYEFARILIPESITYSSKSQFDSLKKMINRYVENRNQ